MRRISLTVREWKHLSGWYHNGLSVKWDRVLWVFIIAHFTNFLLQPKRRWQQSLGECWSFYFISQYVSLIREDKKCSGALLFRQQLKWKHYCKKKKTYWCLLTASFSTGLLMSCYLGALDEEPWCLSVNIMFINPVTPGLILLHI